MPQCTSHSPLECINSTYLCLECPNLNLILLKKIKAKQSPFHPSPKKGTRRKVLEEENDQVWKSTYPTKMDIIEIVIGTRLLHGSKENLGSKTKSRNNQVKAKKIYKGQTPNGEEGFQTYRTI